LSNKLDIDDDSVAVLVDDVVADLLTIGEKAPDPMKVGVSRVVAP
jgi:hypothetical protein